MKPPRRLVPVLLALPLALILAGCGAGAGNDAKTSAGTAGGTSASELGPRAPNQDAGSASDAVAAKPAADAAIQRSVIATGSLRLTTSHLADARQDAMDVAKGAGGHVDDEQSQSDTRGRLDRVDLTLRVPAPAFGTVLDELSALGTVRHRAQSVEDVTTQVIDIDARVKAQRASVRNIRRLFAQAGTVAEIMSIERELSSRQADLDSLKQQKKWLADQTSLSTIRVTLTLPAKHHRAHAAPGFLGGLAGGWHALGATTVAVGTALGAALPFAVVIALMGAPAWLLLRRRRILPVAPPAPEG